MVYSLLNETKVSVADMCIQFSLHSTKSSLQLNGLKMCKHSKDIMVMVSVFSSFIGKSLGQWLNAMIDENVVGG